MSRVRRGTAFDSANDRPGQRRTALPALRVLPPGRTACQRRAPRTDPRALLNRAGHRRSPTGNRLGPSSGPRSPQARSAIGRRAGRRSRAARRPAGGRGRATDRRAGGRGRATDRRAGGRGRATDRRAGGRGRAAGVQPVAEVVQPVVQPVAEVVQPVVQPVAEVVQPVVQPVAEVVQPVVQPVVEPVAEVVQPVSRGRAAGGPAGRRGVQPTVQPVAETVQPVVQPVAMEPIVQPATPTPKPAAQLIAGTVQPVARASSPKLSRSPKSCSPWASRSPGPWSGSSSTSLRLLSPWSSRLPTGPSRPPRPRQAIVQPVAEVTVAAGEPVVQVVEPVLVAGAGPGGSVQRRSGSVAELPVEVSGRWASELLAGPVGVLSGDPVAARTAPWTGSQPASGWPSGGESRSFGSPSGTNVMLAVLSVLVLVGLQRGWRIRPLPVVCRSQRFVLALERPG